MDGGPTDGLMTTECGIRAVRNMNRGPKMVKWTVSYHKLSE